MAAEVKRAGDGMAKKVRAFSGRTARGTAATSAESRNAGELSSRVYLTPGDRRVQQITVTALAAVAHPGGPFRAISFAAPITVQTAHAGRQAHHRQHPD